MKTFKTHRKYTGWEYRAISLQTVLDGKQTAIIYGCRRESDDQPWTKGVELHRGTNFIPDSKDTNWSKYYKDFNKIPPKYLPYIDNLIENFNSTTFDDKCSDLNEN